MPKAVPFYVFCEDVLRLNLTLGQRVLAKCVFGDMQPDELIEDEQALAFEILGGVDTLPDKSKRIIVLSLGRGSGKTTITAAWSVYVAVTANLHRCGPGDIPVAVVVAPDKNTAKLSIRMARELIRANHSLNALVLESSEDRIDIRRPDGRRTAIEAFAASRGGSTIRGRSILTFVLDEAEFFRSDSDYTVNDRGIYGAVNPRLIPGGRGIFLSTPWPVETMMSDLFAKNYGKPKTALAARATTLQMRGDNDPEIQEIIEGELERDPDNAKREFFCEVDVTHGGEFFDGGALSASLDSIQTWPVPRNVLWPVAAGADFAFKQDSSTLCVVQYDGKKYRVSETLELKPKRGQPLKPSEVCKEFAQILKRYGITSIVSDGHYREAIREHLQSYGITIWEAPEGLRGKMDVYTRTKAVLHEGLCVLPDNSEGRRIIEQAKTVVARPSTGGNLSIKIPRRFGTAHGDLVSAWTLAVHRLALARTKNEKPDMPAPGTQECIDWIKARDIEVDKKREQKYLKSICKEISLENKAKGISRLLGFKN